MGSIKFVFSLNNFLWSNKFLSIFSSLLVRNSLCRSLFWVDVPDWRVKRTTHPRHTEYYGYDPDRATDDSGNGNDGNSRSTSGRYERVRRSSRGYTTEEEVQWREVWLRTRGTGPTFLLTPSFLDWTPLSSWDHLWKDLSPSDKCVKTYGL